MRDQNDRLTETVFRTQAISTKPVPKSENLPSNFRCRMKQSVVCSNKVFCPRLDPSTTNVNPGTWYVPDEMPKVSSSKPSYVTCVQSGVTKSTSVEENKSGCKKQIMIHNFTHLCRPDVRTGSFDNLDNSKATHQHCLN